MLCVLISNNENEGNEGGRRNIKAVENTVMCMNYGPAGAYARQWKLVMNDSKAQRNLKKAAGIDFKSPMSKRFYGQPMKAFHPNNGMNLNSSSRPLRIHRSSSHMGKCAKSSHMKKRANNNRVVPVARVTSTNSTTSTNSKNTVMTSFFEKM